MNDLDSLKFQLEVERTNYLRNAEELVRQRDVARADAKRLRDREIELLAALEDESVRKSSVIVEVIALRLEAQALRLQVLKCAEETQKACSEAAQYKEWFTRAEEELQEARARADKAEADLASCLAATNEVLQEALAVGRESQEGRMRKALERIVAWDFSAMRVPSLTHPGETDSYGMAYGSNGERDYMRKVAQDALTATPGDEVKPKRQPSHSMRCLPLGLDSWRCGEGCTIHAVSMEDDEVQA